MHPHFFDRLILLDRPHPLAQIDYIRVALLFGEHLRHCRHAVGHILEPRYDMEHLAHLVAPTLGHAPKMRPRFSANVTFSIAILRQGPIV